jgi:uncharacterized protein (DUF2147 family)
MEFRSKIAFFYTEHAAVSSISSVTKPWRERDQTASFNVPIETSFKIRCKSPSRPIRELVRATRRSMAVSRSALGAAIFGATLSFATATMATAAPTDPKGDWLVEKGLAIIRVVDCGGQYWGVVVWEQRPGIDDKNPDPNKRNRPTLGMPILLGMAPTEPNLWTGEIYNSEDGHTYSAKIKLANPDVLRVEGCVLGFLCGGQNWTRTTQQEATTGAAPGSTRAQAGQARSAPQADERTAEVCSGLVGGAGSTHQRGLK